MAFIVKDTAPQYGGIGESYFVGMRRVRDPHGRECEAADFGEKQMAKKFEHKGDAESFVKNLNHMAQRKQFVVEELSVYGLSYGKRKRSNGFMGFGTIPSEEPHAASQAGFNWHGGGITNDGFDGDGYNGF